MVTRTGEKVKKYVGSNLACQLAPTAKKDGLRLGQFTRAMAVDANGRPDKICPMTIALTPQEDDTFLLGCGWCNG